MSKIAVPTILALGLTALNLVAQSPSHGVQLAQMDRTTRPCDDFFQFANGGWLKSTQIPSEYPTWGAFVEIYERNLLVLKEIQENAAKNTSAPKGSTLQKVGDFYASGMDEAAIEKAGLSPLASRFARIQGLANAKDLATEMARLHLEGIGSAFGFSVGIDDKRSSAYIAQLRQDGLGLPDRDYYTKDDDNSKDLRAKYLEHMTRMFELIGDKPAEAKAHAGTVLSLETRLAKASMTAVERRDPNAVYHKMTREELSAQAPHFDWKAYFTALGLPDSEKHLLVRQPAFMAELSSMTQQIPLEDWKTYLRWHLILGTSDKLSSPFLNESFAFYGRILNGTPELSARWKRVQGASDAALGEAIGQLFVEKSFTPEAKRKALEMVKNLQAALRERIQKLDWMTGATRQKAIAKLDAFIIKIGYPDTWRDYSKLEINRGPFVLNVLAANTFESRRNLGKLGKPVDRSEWGMTPHEVNAYYEPTTNEICFPAGILQPPFFDPQADDAVNYGAIGLVIGHEMTHGFDDQGCQYDKEGNLLNWWTAEDTKAYASRQDIVVKQYDGYKALPDQAVNGKLTLGENIADFGGLKIAFSAFKKSLEGKPRPADIDGFTPEQRFFLGYAQSWHELTRPEYLRVLLNTDPHSPAKYRVIGPLSNLPEFHEAFGCGDGGAMVRPAAERPTIW